MKLHAPIDNFDTRLHPLGDVTQYFGTNKELYSKAVCTVSGCLQGHNGWDIVAPHGTPIKAVMGGKVVEVKDNPNGYGKHVRLLCDTYDGTPGKHEWVYGHLHRIDVVLGQTVARGTQIGLMGNTGFVVSGATPYWATNPYAGTHLHLGVRCFIPWDGTGTYNFSYPSGDKGTIKDYNNGYFGALNFTPDAFEGYVKPPAPVHRFTRDLEYGMRNDADVRALQDILKYEGLLAEHIPSTGNYLEETRKSVLAYQKRYNLITPYQEWTYRGKYCYQITRAHLNSRYG